MNTNNFFKLCKENGIDVAEVTTSKSKSFEFSIFKNALENYKKFLKSGGSNYPSEELKYAGIDITKPDVLIDAIKFFDETVKEYQKILRKR